MKLFRIVMIALLVGGIGTPSWASDLLESGVKAVEQQVAAAPPSVPTGSAGATTLKWTGRALFVGGIAVGLFGFINDRNGEFSEFGEADSSNKKLGAAGLSAAFAGGVLVFLGT